MNASDFERFNELLTGLVLAQQWEPWDARVIPMLFKRFSAYTFEEVEAAHMDYAEKEKVNPGFKQHRPGLSQIFDRLPKSKAEISPKERAALAWDQVALDLPAGRFTGRHKVDDISKRIIQALGGMDSLSRVPNGENGGDDLLQWKRKQFLEQYVTAYDVTEARNNQAARLEQSKAALGSGSGVKGLGGDL